jgi:hypothetical protein
LHAADPGQRHDVADNRLGDEAEANEQTADRLLLVLLFGKGDPQLVGGDQPLLDQ